MYELYIVTTHESWDWWFTSLSRFNTTNEDFLSWQKKITESSNAKSYNFNINSLNNVATDLWTFSTKDELLDFYKMYSSEDSNVNYNRLYPWGQMLDLITQAGASIEIYLVDSMGIKEVIYNNTDLIAQ
jgi:hypothetical protein